MRGKQLAACGLIAVSLTASSALAKDDSEAHQQVTALWNKVLAHCGESYFYAGSFFDHSGGMVKLQAHQDELAEYRKVFFNLVPTPLTDADALNGLQYRGRLTMVSALYRKRDKGKWGLWVNGPANGKGARDIDDLFASVLRDVVGDSFEMGAGGAMALEILKVKGTWHISRADVTGGRTLSGNHFYKLADVLAQPTAKYDCQKADIVVPPEVIAEQKAKAEAAVEAERGPREKYIKELTKNREEDGRSSNDPVNGIAFLTVSQDEADFIKRSGDLHVPPQQFAIDAQNRLKIADRFPSPDTIRTDQYLSPGTTFNGLDWPNGRGTHNVYTRIGAKSLTLVTVTSGPHSGQVGLIDSRNFSSNNQHVQSADEIEKRRMYAETIQLVDHRHAVTTAPVPYVPLDGAMWNTAIQMTATKRPPDDLKAAASKLADQTAAKLDAGTSYEPLYRENNLQANSLLNLPMVGTNDPRLFGLPVTIKGGPRDGEQGLIPIVNYSKYLEQATLKKCSEISPKGCDISAHQ